jgi:glucan phosphoethanolaminetransferase (alkaline phosphatase superfamily)
MKKSNTTYLPRMDIKIRLSYLFISIFLFLIFRGPISYILFVFSIISFLWGVYYENGTIYYINSKNNSVISPGALTSATVLFSFPFYLFVLWIILRETLFLIQPHILNLDNFLDSSYFNGICIIISAFIIVGFFKLLHILVFKSLEQEKTNKRLKGI